MLFIFLVFVWRKKVGNRFYLSLRVLQRPKKKKNELMCYNAFHLANPIYGYSHLCSGLRIPLTLP